MRRPLPTVGQVTSCVDVDEIYALLGVLRDAAEDFVAVRAELDSSGAADGLAVGAYAVQDAVADLVAQWAARADDVAAAADAMRATVGAAAEEYTFCETRVDHLVRTVPLLDLTSLPFGLGPADDAPMATGVDMAVLG